MTDWKSQGPPSKIWIAGCILCGILLFFVVVELGYAKKALPASFSFAAISLAARSRWDLRNRPWFWIIIVTVVLVHLAILYEFTFQFDIHPVSILTPFIVLDFTIIVLIIFLAEKIFSAKRS